MKAIERGFVSASKLFPTAMLGLMVVLAAGCVGRAAKSNDAQMRKGFDGVRAVLQHPRCQNCHVPGDAPLQFDAGLSHSQNVQRGPVGLGREGMYCGTCHGDKNLPASYGMNVPPGAPNWRLPPPQVKMVFAGLSARELCSSIKDPQKTGGRDLAAVLDYVTHDELVGWGWDPGPGRTTPPLSRAEFVQAFQDWMRSGAPCPQS